MWPILIGSITALAISIERLLVIARAEEETAHLQPQILQAIQNRQSPLVEHLCSQHRETPLARMVTLAVRHPGAPRAELLERMEESAAVELPALERHLPMLGTIAHLSPLLGLLGTVTGLVRCFQVIQEKTTSIHPVNPGDLAGGIWEALLTTVFGLLVAIPAYAIYNYLVYRLSHFSTGLEAAALEIADALSAKKTHVA